MAACPDCGHYHATFHGGPLDGRTIHQVDEPFGHVLVGVCFVNDPPAESGDPIGEGGSIHVDAAYDLNVDLSGRSAFDPGPTLHYTAANGGKEPA